MVYPYIKQEHLELHLTNQENHLFLVERGSNLEKFRLGMKQYQKWALSRITASYLLLCDGQKTQEEIGSQLGITMPFIMECLLEGMIKIGVMAVSECPITSRDVFVTGSFETQGPLHASVEITDYCNFNCEHCYVSASTQLKQQSREKVMFILETLRKQGVKVIELTGGECTTHTHFKELLMYCAEHFHLVSIISNGYLMGKDDTLTTLISRYGNICVQVSIDGNEPFNDQFRGKQGAFKSACHAIDKLVKAGTVVRLAASISEKNKDQVEFIYKLAKELDVDALAIAPVSSFGRAVHNGCTQGKSTVLETITEILAPYAGDKVFVANHEAIKNYKQTKSMNCGGGWRSFALNAVNGQFRACLFLDSTQTFGNIYEDRYEDIFAIDKIGMFKDAPNPSIQLETCHDCSYVGECSGCFANAFHVIKQYYPECPWKKAYLPNYPL